MPSGVFGDDFSSTVTGTLTAKSDNAETTCAFTAETITFGRRAEEFSEPVPLLLRVVSAAQRPTSYTTSVSRAAKDPVRHMTPFRSSAKNCGEGMGQSPQTRL